MSDLYQHARCHPVLEIRALVLVFLGNQNIHRLACYHAVQEDQSFPMKDVEAVLRQKEQDLERVRKEILALLTVIPLLTNDEPTFDIIQLLECESARVVDDIPKYDMDGMEIYYPFIGNLRAQGRLG
jgi:hypothetical protein